MAGMTLRALGGRPGRGAEVSAPQSPPGDEADNHPGGNASEFERVQDLETPRLPPLFPAAPWGHQVCLRPWAEGSGTLDSTPVSLTLNKITCIVAELIGCVFVHSFPSQKSSFSPHPHHLPVFTCLCASPKLLTKAMTFY